MKGLFAIHHSPPTIPAGNVHYELAPFHLLKLWKGFVFFDDVCESLLELSYHLSLRFAHRIKLDLGTK